MSAKQIAEAVRLINSDDPEMRVVGSGASRDEIEDAERRLGVRFPEDYRKFLAVLGHGGTGGIAIMGLRKTDDVAIAPDLLDANFEARAEGLPPSLVLVEDGGDGSFVAMDLTEGAGFGRTVVWPLGGSDVADLEEVSESFGDYLMLRLSESAASRSP